MSWASFHSPAARSSRRLLLTLALFGFASGLPLALTGSTLQAWLTQAGVEVKTLGALTLVGLPYTFKFLWAPLVDRFPLSRRSRRRGWLVATQFMLALACLALAYSDPATELSRIVAVALLIACASATQDIAADAYRAEALPTAQRGLGAGISVAGYRVAMIVSGAGALVLADRLGFATSFIVVAALFAANIIITLVAAEPRDLPSSPTTLAEAFSTQLWSLFSRPGMLGFCALIALYKLGDAFAGSLTMTFLLRGQGFSLTEIGSIYKALGVTATIAGGVFGGVWLSRLGLYRSLLLFGVLQAVTNAGFWGLASVGKSLMGMIAVVALENFSGGMGTSALLALLMALCDRRYTATHFALLSAIASLARVFVGVPAGQVAASGWAPFFAWSVVWSVPGLVIVWAMRRRIVEAEAGPTPQRPKNMT